MIPQLKEAMRLHHAGMRLVKLEKYAKRPEGLSWNKNFIKEIDPSATGYGLPLEVNNLCSIDPDNWELASVGMAALGFDLEAIMAAGVRTKSTRPGSGGRSTFRAEGEIFWKTFRSLETGTVLELRAYSPNLQDCVPGVVYKTKDGTMCTQEYANGKRLDEAPEIPDNLFDWWEKMESVDFCHEQEEIFFKAIANHLNRPIKPSLSISTGRNGSKLAFNAPQIRTAFNAANQVQQILERHNYDYDRTTKRYAPPTATGAPAVRQIPNKEGLWHSDHASDPLMGTFDAWIAHVVLDHKGDIEAAKKAWMEDADMQLAPFSEEASPIKTNEAIESKESPAGIAIKNALPVGEFIREYEVVDYLLDLMIEEKRLYTLTAPTGTGKTAVALRIAEAISLGVPFGSVPTKQAGVLILAGENPNDVRVRLMAMCEMNSDLKDAPIRVVKGSFNLLQSKKQIEEHLNKFPDTKLIIIDTLQAFFTGDDFNDNAQMKKFASACRGFADLGMAVLICAHPSKNPSKEFNVPFGGGTILNEVDGNFSLWKNDDGTIELFWCKKFRGGFQPVQIELVRATASEAVNSHGIASETVVANIIDADREERIVKEAFANQLKVLRFYFRNKDAHISKSNIARAMGWVDSQDRPELTKFNRSLERLLKEGQLTQNSTGIFISKKGKEFLNIYGH